MLAINGQLTTSYMGPLNAIDEALAPAFAASMFMEDRLVRKDNPDCPRDARPFAKVGRAFMPKMSAKEKMDASKKQFALANAKIDVERKVGEPSFSMKLALCGTSEY